MGKYKTHYSIYGTLHYTTEKAFTFDELGPDEWSIELSFLDHEHLLKILKDEGFVESDGLLIKFNESIEGHHEFRHFVIDPKDLRFEKFTDEYYIEGLLIP